MARSFCVRGRDALRSAAMTEPAGHYHVELKSFPHVARAFNLDRATLDARFLRPFADGEPIDYDDRRWPAERTKLTVFEGTAVSDGTRGLGRGWGEVTATAGTSPTRRSPRSGAAPTRGPSCRRSSPRSPRWRPARRGSGCPTRSRSRPPRIPGGGASEQLSLAEQAVWEMLHRGRLGCSSRTARAVPAERWQPIVLSWAEWAGDAGPVRLHALARGRERARPSGHDVRDHPLALGLGGEQEGPDALQARDVVDVAVELGDADDRRAVAPPSSAASRARLRRSRRASTWSSAKVAATRPARIGRAGRRAASAHVGGLGVAEPVGVDAIDDRAGERQPGVLRACAGTRSPPRSPRWAAVTSRNAVLGACSSRSTSAARAQKSSVMSPSSAKNVDRSLSRSRPVTRRSAAEQRRGAAAEHPHPDPGRAG